MNLDEILRGVFPPEGGDLGSSSMVQSRETMEQERVIRSDPQRQPSTGEMTLEDFLVKAGVVVKEADKGARCVSPTASTDPVHASESYGYSRHWLQAYSGISESSSSISSSPLGEAVHRRLSSTQSLGGKQGISRDLGKQTAERKQKRMIKNRESAARSRARKQAYANELENKISRLEEENKMLKKHRDLEKIIHCLPDPEPRIRLRRTSTAPF